jgi:hypothetical protein
MPVPIPQRKPQINSVSNGFGSILDGIFNTATNVFDRGIDVLGQVWEAEQIAKIRKVEAAASSNRQAKLNGAPTGINTFIPTGGTQSPNQLIALGLLAVGALFISK